jgi:hypothetical protein
VYKEWGITGKGLGNVELVGSALNIRNFEILFTI